MGKHIGSVFRKYVFWMFMILLSNLLLCLYLWVADVDGFKRLIFVVILGTAGLCCIGVGLSCREESRKSDAIAELLDMPDGYREDQAVSLARGSEKRQIRMLGERLREKNREIKESINRLEEYEEYMELWAHEIKAPLALMTFVLDNRKDAFPDDTYQRLEYARNQMQEDIDKMMYYARLKMPHQDYLFETVSLQECCREVMREYAALLQERSFTVINKVQDLQVNSDKKGLIFMISQSVSNAIKYADPQKDNAILTLYTASDQEKGTLLLGIKDNGIGVREYDMPFIFDKGFTGDTGRQYKASTGMGLYLLKQMSEQLGIGIKAESSDGFELLLLFPEIE